jgi:N-(5-amino-5-carboxypentanoyl)-L-cysteinyl-D-valine synthase
LTERLRNIISHCSQKRDSHGKYTISDFNEFEPYVIFNEKIRSHEDRIFIFPPVTGGAESYFHSITPRVDNKNLIMFNNYYIHLYDKNLIMFNNYYIHLYDKLGRDYENKVSYADLANNYIPLIRAIQPKGPYNFFGWSFGGVIAF